MVVLGPKYETWSEKKGDFANWWKSTVFDAKRYKQLDTVLVKSRPLIIWDAGIISIST
jgi:hypothetical protein